MKTYKLLLGLGITVLLLSTALLISRNLSNNKKVAEDTVIINIQPLDGIKDVDSAVKKFEEQYSCMFNKKCIVRVLPHKNTPKEVYNEAHTRFDAKKLLMYIHNNTPEDEYTIGVTDKDISTTRLGHKDYGVLGLSYLGGSKRACVTSTYRLKRNEDLWKLMAHEFTHGFFGIDHCIADEDYCIMQDAKGKNPKLENKFTFCEFCGGAIIRKIDERNL